MYRSFLLAAAIAATFLAGCAPTDSTTTAAADDPDAKTHVAGSRIPARESSASERNAVGGINPTPAAHINPPASKPGVAGGGPAGSLHDSRARFRAAPPLSLKLIITSGR